MTNRPAVEKLRREHPVDGFECGHTQLDLFLIRYAFAAQQAGGSTTYVGLIDRSVVGFYTLVFGDVAYAEAPDRLVKGLARHPVPLMVLARLAVHRAWHGQGIGAGLLRDAMTRTLRAADIAGLRALAAHAKDENAAAFYQHFGFTPSPTDHLHMFVLLKDIRRMLGD